MSLQIAIGMHILLLQNMLSRIIGIYANDLSYYMQYLTFSDTLEFFIIYTARL